MVSIDRVKAILVTPRTEWPRIEAEPATVPSIVRDWLVWLAAIPAIAAFVGFSLIGFGAMGLTVRVPLLAGIAQAIASVVLAVAMTWLIAKVADALAPRFGGRSDFLGAFKLIAYGATASMVGGVFYALPSLSVLALLGSLYSIWLIRLGVPVTMKVPEARAWAYTAVLIACAVVATLLLSAITAALTPSPPRMGGDARISTPRGEVSVDAGKLDDFAKRMEEAARKAEQASRSGDPEAAAKAAGQVIGALSGAGQRPPIAPEALKAAFPDSLADLPRGRWETGSATPMGLPATRAQAEYGSGGRRLELEVLDVGGLSGLMAVAGWAGAIGERETQDERERTFRDGARIVHESERKDGSRAEYKVVLANGVIVQASGRGVPLPELKRAAESIDWARLEQAGKP